jgi:hypothetical protein
MTRSAQGDPGRRPGGRRAAPLRAPQDRRPDRRGRPGQARRPHRRPGSPEVQDRVNPAGPHRNHRHGGIRRGPPQHGGKARGARHRAPGVRVRPEAGGFAAEQEILAPRRSAASGSSTTTGPMLGACHGELDYVATPTPIRLHAEMHAAITSFGIPAYVEKPPTLDYLELERMIAADSRARKSSLVGFNFIVEKTRLALKERLLSGEFGAIRGGTLSGLWPRPSGYFARNGWAGGSSTTATSCSTRASATRWRTSSTTCSSGRGRPASTAGPRSPPSGPSSTAPTRSRGRTPSSWRPTSRRDAPSGSPCPTPAPARARAPRP